MILDWPTLFALDPRLQHQGAVLTFETVKMKVPAKSPQFLDPGLSLLGDNIFLADSTHRAKPQVIVSGTVDFVLLVQSHLLRVIV